MAPILVALALVWLIFSVESPVFLTSRNLTSLTNQIAVTATVALGLVFVLIVRQIDLSLAALSALCGAVGARLLVDAGWDLGFAIAGATVVGAIIGATQGTIVTLFKAPAFIVTLGGYFIMGAGLLWLLPATSVIPLANTPLETVAGTFLPVWISYVLALAAVIAFAALRFVHHRGRVREGIPSHPVRSVLFPAAALAATIAIVLVFVFNAGQGVPTPALIVLGLMAGLSYVAEQTPYGRRLYAIGGNPEAARRAGIPVGPLTTSAFAIAGALAGLAGIISASRQLGVSAEASDLTLLLNALAAVVIGGISLFGGRGNVWGALIGSLVIGSIANGLFLVNASTQERWTLIGLVLIGAVIVDSLITRKAASVE
jgi:D-xylose transport system permease protein